MEGPALALLRCATTGFRDPTGFSLRIQLWLGAGARTLRQRPQPLFDEALAQAFDRSTPDSEGCGEGWVVPALRRFEQHTGARHFAGCMCPAVQKVFELFAFLVPERDEVFFLGHRWSSSLA